MSICNFICEGSCLCIRHLVKPIINLLHDFGWVTVHLLTSVTPLENDQMTYISFWPMKKRRSLSGKLGSIFLVWTSLRIRTLCCSLWPQCQAQFLTRKCGLMNVEWVNKNGTAPLLRMSNVTINSVHLLHVFQVWPISCWKRWLFIILETCQNLITDSKRFSWHRRPRLPLCYSRGLNND